MDVGEAEHILNLEGTGYFSRASCTGCDFVMRGHADDIQRAFDRQHEVEQPFVAPPRVALPEAAEDPTLAKIEQRIIILLTHRVDFQTSSALYVALGLAEARSYLLGDHSDPRGYVSVLMARITHMSKHQREKLRHPTRTRVEQHQLMEG
jgi:hypothetical protein